MIFFGDMHISAKSLFQVIESAETREWPHTDISLMITQFYQISQFMRPTC